MKHRSIFVAAFIVVAAAFPVCAQQTGAPVSPSQQAVPVEPPPPPPPHPEKKEPRPFTSEVRMQGLLFGNFYQAARGQSAKDVTAVQAAYRGIFRPRKTITDLYGEASVIRFTNISAANPYSLRAGVRRDGKTDSFELFADRGSHRPAFAVGNRTNFATVTTLSAQYSHKLTSKWQLGVNGIRERQRFDVKSDQANDYSRATLVGRYRFNDAFQPFVGYNLGYRDVQNNIDSYHEHYWTVGFNSMPNYSTYASISYSNSHRLFKDAYAVPGAAFSSDDAHPQWSGYAAYRLNPHWSLGTYFSRDTNRSPISYRNYSTSFVLLGATARF